MASLEKLQEQLQELVEQDVWLAEKTEGASRVKKFQDLRDITYDAATEITKDSPVYTDFRLLWHDIEVEARLEEEAEARG